MDKKGFGQALSQIEFLALKKGKHHGFNAAYKLYSDHVYSLALHIVKNKHTALDLMQLVFEALLVKSYTINSVDALGTWLKQCTVNVCMDYFRKNKNEFYRLSEESDSEKQVDVSQPNLASDTQALDMLKRLPLIQRSIVYFYSVSGLNHREIALKLGINETSSRKNYSRSMKQLRSWLNKSGYNDDKF